ALEAAQQCTELREEWNKGWFRKGEALFALQRYDEAEEAYRQALDRAPDDATVKQCLLLALEAQQGFLLRQMFAGREFCVGRGRNVIESQIYRSAQQMRNFIYLIGDAHSREAVVVDGAWDVEGILRYAEAERVKLVGAVVTHYHFDHTGGMPPPPFDALGIKVPGIRELAATHGLKSRGKVPWQGTCVSLWVHACIVVPQRVCHRTPQSDSLVGDCRLTVFRKWCCSRMTARFPLHLPSADPASTIPLSPYCHPPVPLLRSPCPPTAVPLSPYCHPPVPLLPSLCPPTGVPLSPYWRPSVPLLAFPRPPTAVPTGVCQQARCGGAAIQEWRSQRLHCGGPGMAEVWWRGGGEVWWRYVEVWWRYVEVCGGMVKVRRRYGGGVVEVWWRCCGGMVEVWWRCCGGMVEVWWRYGGGMVEVWWRYGGGVSVCRRLLIGHPSNFAAFFLLATCRAPGHDDGVLISGDTLFIGSCGRLDLPDCNREAMYDSLQKLAALPPDTRVYPGHDYGGAFTSISKEKATGFLRPMTKQQWLASQGR
ncbi:unnamed protein product, partial [Closterium sp. Yama58-4]